MASPTSAEPSPTVSRDRLHDDLQAEYAKLVDIVSAFDQRLLTIKGWGVTLSLASLGLGFQQNHYGLFLVAAASGLAFWLIEATTKLHQIRYYPRMGDIEVIAYELYRDHTPSVSASSPLIDWSWYMAWARLRRLKSDDRRRGFSSSEPQPWPEQQQGSLLRPWFFSHVAFPHVVALVLGTVLFMLGLFGVFGPI